jgi:hypothetical protein
MRKRPKRPRIGRPPRTDDPVRLLIVLPGKSGRWLRAQAVRERRAQGDIVNDGLGLYRRRAIQGRERS